MIKLKFIWMLWTGVLTPCGDHEGQRMYNMQMDSNYVIEYAYRAEIMNYLRTGTFEYDDMLDEASVEPRELEYDCIIEEEFYSKN
jgi:hypothetical protein